MRLCKTKKISSLIIGLFIGVSIPSIILIDTVKADIILNEGFESGTIPSGWGNTGWILDFYGSPHNGSHWIYSWAAGDTLTTPVLSFEDDTELSFWYRAEISSHPMSLQVKLDNSLVVWSHTSFTHTSYLQAVVDLSAYSGAHTISFIGMTSDFYGQLLDDIMVSYPNDPPVACFTWVDADGPGIGTVLNFNAGCSTDDYGINLYAWDWDNNGVYDNTYAVPTASHNFGDLTVHTVVLRVTDTIGQTDTVFDSTVHASADYPPTACFTWVDVDGTGIGTVLNLNAGCSTDDNGLNLYEWDWTTDGVYDYTGGPTASHDYGDTNTHLCSLRVTDSIGQTDVFSDTVQAMGETVDVDQSTFNRGFPIRHALDGDWGGAQNFTPTIDSVTKVEVYLRKMGTPLWDLTVELREDGPQATLLDTIVIPAANVPTSWTWLSVDFTNTPVGAGSDVYIVIPPAPPGQPNSYGYEWGYALGNQYDGGAFWFTRDGGGLWRDLPTMYEFTFKTYGYP